jgi:ribosome biogenesis GTPase
VQRAVQNGDIDPQRVTRWRKLMREEAHNNESLAERRARGRARGRLYRNIQDDMRQRKNRG